MHPEGVPARLRSLQDRIQEEINRWCRALRALNHRLECSYPFGIIQIHTRFSQRYLTGLRASLGRLLVAFGEQITQACLSLPGYRIWDVYGALCECRFRKPKACQHPSRWLSPHRATPPVYFKYIMHPEGVPARLRSLQDRIQEEINRWCRALRALNHRLECSYPFGIIQIHTRFSQRYLTGLRTSLGRLLVAFGDPDNAGMPVVAGLPG